MGDFGDFSRNAYILGQGVGGEGGIEVQGGNNSEKRCQKVVFGMIMMSKSTLHIAIFVDAYMMSGL